MPVIDLSFPVQGNLIPVDHSYSLYGAICKKIPDFHERFKTEHESSGEKKCYGICPINGILVGDRKMQISRNSHLRIRVDNRFLKDFYLLAGKTLCIEGHTISLGIPRPVLLKAAPVLQSRLVVIKGFMEPSEFLEAAKRQLLEMGINGLIQFERRKRRVPVEGRTQRGKQSEPLKRTVRIRNKEIVGFALKVYELNDHDSIKLQEIGLGGRRRFGCGIFLPMRS
jgi:CRISPR-associated protein Cas6